MVAAAGGFDESLELLIDQLKRVGELRDVDDDEEGRRTPLMMAKHSRKRASTRRKLLVLKASVAHRQVRGGKTARMYAAARRNER